MADKKVAIMVIKVDLACEKCRKKIKKVLCSIPQIQSQIYDEKANTVIITVVCCCPEKIKKKICCKGGESIKGIEIKEPEKPKPPSADKPKEPEKPKEKPKEPEKPKDKPKEPEKPKDKPKPEKTVVFVEPTKPKPPDAKPKPPEPTAKPPPAPAPKAPEPAPKAPVPLPSYPTPAMPCCIECYGGHGGGPCMQGYGGPPPCYEAYGRPVYDSWGGGYGYYGGCRRGCYVGRCDCMSETSPSACSIM